MRLVTFNIHHGTVGRNGPVDAHRLGQVCAGFDADVIALQEVDVGTFRTGRVDLVAEVARACGTEHVFGRSRRLPGGWYGNALLVRGLIQNWSVSSLPRVPRRRWSQERRTLLRAQIKVDQVVLTAAVTHLAVPPRVNGPQLDRALALVATAPQPSVLLGDLNRGADAVAPAARAGGLVLVGHGPTFPAGVPKSSIDHVLVSPDLVVGATEVRSTEMSDHAALIVEVDLAAGASHTEGR